MMLETGLLETALQILEHLELENDKSVDVWYLYGLGNFLLASASSNEPDLELCKESWGCLAMALRLAERQEYEEAEVLEHIREIQGQLLSADPTLSQCNLEEEEEEPEDLDIPDTDDEYDSEGAME
ncbi:hypothetical protein DSO57_1022028 [Entomophthora muscae]|uniref:Uncharacterized protein n=1 Tax=Entomophthora muscae TaxID=34485 RepID=A0ACC2UE29_9FUNG|nr:hypothetical protein DSO57_1022028 [Entomophthora muscae]